MEKLNWRNSAQLFEQVRVKWVFQLRHEENKLSFRAMLLYFFVY